MIIKTDKLISAGNLILIVGVIILQIIMIVEMTIPGQWMVIHILSIVNLCFLLQLIQINKTLIMDSEGCTVKLWKISKVYSWNELKIKRIEKFTRKNEGWTQGVVFCKHTIFKPKSIHPENYAFLAPFLSYFFVCFIEEDDEKKRIMHKRIL